MFWIAKTKKSYICDICKKEIFKKEKRLVYGFCSPVYTMIDKNICLQCLRNLDIDEIIYRLNLTQSLETYDYLKKELKKIKNKIFDF